MRNRGILKVLALFGVGPALLPISMWAASALRAEPDGSAGSVAMVPIPAAAPLASLPGSLDEDRLEAEARHAAANALAARKADRIASARSRRQERTSRGGTRSRLVQARTPVMVPGAPDDVWAKLRRCEAGGDYTRNSGNGYYGAYQFSAATWRSLGYPGLPHQASPAVQDEAARKLQHRSGWGQWPACSRRIGAR